MIDCIGNAEVPDQVRHRPIHGFYGWRSILKPPQPAVQVPHGESSVAHIRRRDVRASSSDDVRDALWDGDDPGEAYARSPRSRSPRRDQDDTFSLLAYQAQPPIRQLPLLDQPHVAQHFDHDNAPPHRPGDSSDGESMRAV